MGDNDHGIFFNNIQQLELPGADSLGFFIYSASISRASNDKMSQPLPTPQLSKALFHLECVILNSNTQDGLLMWSIKWLMMLHSITARLPGIQIR